ncbi:mCG146140, partial [Mus musculus]
LIYSSLGDATNVPSQTRHKSPLQEGRKFIQGIEQLDPTVLKTAPVLLTGNMPASLNTELGYCCKHSCNRNSESP